MDVRADPLARVGGAGEVDVVGGDDGQFVTVGEVEYRRLVRPVVITVPLQLDIEPVAEEMLQAEKPRFSPARELAICSPK